MTKPIPKFSFRVDLRWCVDELLKDGRITQREANLATSTSRSRDQLSWHPLQVLAHFEFADANAADSAILDLDTLTTWLARKAGQPVFHIDPLKIDVAAVTNVMSYAFAERHGILAVQASADEVVIASAQPFHDEWEEHLRQTLRDRVITRVMANPAELSRYSIEFYKLSRAIQGANASESVNTNKGGSFEQMLELGNTTNPDANDQHIVNIVDWLLQYAFDQRASDIHLEPRRDGSRVRFRIDGVLHNVYEFPGQIMNAVTARIKILGRMNIAEKRKPQDGRLKTRNPRGREIELRLSTLPTAFGEKMVMRIFDPDVLVRGFADLGLVGEDHEKWQKMVAEPNGIILVTGPTGSGKTTTLYSTLRQLATDEVNVCTIEDPIEMIEPAFNQMQVQHNIELTFAEGIRALMRQDPDIIMVGEVRDGETADMAMQAALTGHLVLSTVHTNDAPSTVTRLVDLGVPSYLVASTVLGIMAQRLVRTLCPHCKVQVPADEAAWTQLVHPWKSPVPKTIYAPKGCLECRGTGYLGRVGLYEIMLLSPELKRVITNNAPLSDIRNQAWREGLLPLRISGAQKIAQGLTTIEEVLRVAPLS